MRDVFTAAKAVSTAAVISNNRVLFGIGVGYLAEEFALTGQAFRNRGARTDEMLDVIRNLLRGGMVEFHGRFHDFPPVQMSPVPTLPIPVVVGGESDAAIRRAARWNGWMSSPLDDDLGNLESNIARLRRARQDLGKVDEPFEIIAIIKRNPSLDLCQRLEAMGVTATMRFPWYYMGVPTSSVDYKRRTMEEFAENVMTKMNRATA
jgi:alkanesulfonate monooxygenase SsuD/methylene tetrahydromethanopterin reductase-like flavin-dependent oxidoreductase (luciferase family)